MCGRYYVDDDAVERVIGTLINEMNRGEAKTGEIFPGDKVLAAANSRAMNIRAFPMEWGFTAQDGRRIINARSETAAERPMFRESLASRRCLLPASIYYEWKEKRKYVIRPAGKGVFFLAGIYRIENGRPVFTVLTRECSTSVSDIHDRMPVMLPPDMLGAWMDRGSDPGRMMRDSVTDMMWEAANG